MTSFLRIREKRESLLIYTLLWNGRHFLCDLIFCWIGNKALPYLKPSSWHFVLKKVTTKQYGTNEDMVKGSMILEAFFIIVMSSMRWTKKTACRFSKYLGMQFDLSCHFSFLNSISKTTIVFLIGTYAICVLDMFRLKVQEVKSTVESSIMRIHNIDYFLNCYENAENILD